ncbi:MAG: hypothetical protein NDI61_05855 [Bdellovibrionaceae bacterium]|nr:hypothetical protein [Pseudobdellovibrionaceae bacterium]
MDRTSNRTDKDDTSLAQIEYLLHQSTQGIHFIFDRAEIVRVLSQHQDDQDFFTFDNMGKVQQMLTQFLERPTISEKRSFLERLSPEEHALLIRAYFHLVENTILAHSKVRH